MNQHSGAATLPRGFRFSGHDAPKTPEPTTQGEEAQMAQIPSPPRPRLKLKRRVVSQLSAPTQQFLASVAAADVPIPSIEEPETDPRDFEMSGINVLSRLHEDDRDMHLLQPRGRTFSPPKTPAPGFVPSLSPTRYPNWTIDSAISSSVESTPDYESSRPSTSRSTQTSASLFSRISHLSDDEHCDNSEVDAKERYVFSPDDDVEYRGEANAKGKLRKAPWTKAMSDHLWSTFVLYLQDPKVTPFRMGKSCIPPHGVMLRVSREAKRSWKGSKALIKTTKPGEGRKSGSSTPTAESSGTYMQWPHTCAATRSHLRELCKLKAASGVKHNLLSRSPTPFTHSAARHWNRRSTPGRTPSGFTQDMSMSLVVSTSDAMQPQGPLAQLTKSTPEPAPEPTPESSERIPFPAFAGPAVTTFEGEPSFAERQRLGSPFGARSYGPSSSGSLAAALGGSPMPRRLTHTVGPRRLQSPVRLSRTSTQKRRHTQSSDPRKRPSIDSSLWIDPSTRAGGSAATMEATRSADFSSTNTNRFDEFFIPRIPVEPAFSTSSSMPNVGGQLEAPALLPPPPRLGSPFSGTNSSFSFPNRLHRSQHGASVDLGMLGRPFATFQQPADSNAPRTTLAGRLAYIDQRLKELHRRRRSESPL